jgi:hypothetical protein
MNLENLTKKIKIGVAVLSLVSALSIGTAQAEPVGKHFFECNSWEDIYGDDKIHYPDGYHGVKNNFKDNEEIIFVGHDPYWMEGDDVEYVLYTSNNKFVFKGDFAVHSDGEWYHAGESIDEDLMKDIMSNSNGGDGDYKIIWFTNGEFDGQDEFEVSSSN